MEAGGTFHGNGTTCENRTCDDCPCDFDNDGVVDDDDLDAFLAAYQAGNADVNGDGQTDQRDVEAFMVCFLSPGAECGR